MAAERARGTAVAETLVRAWQRGLHLQNERLSQKPHVTATAVAATLAREAEHWNASVSEGQRVLPKDHGMIHIDLEESDTEGRKTIAHESSEGESSEDEIEEGPNSGDEPALEESPKTTKTRIG